MVSQRPVGLGIPLFLVCTLDIAAQYLKNMLFSLISTFITPIVLPVCLTPTAKNEDELELMVKRDFSTLLDFDDDDFDPTLDLPGLQIMDMDGRRIRVDSIVEHRLTAIFLIRGFGCIMGKYLASKILAKVNDFEELGVQLVVVAHGTPEAAVKWKKETSFPGTVFCDSDNVLVKTLSCKRGYKYILSPRSLLSVQKALSEGFRSGAVDGEHSFVRGSTRDQSTLLLAIVCFRWFSITGSYFTLDVDQCLRLTLRLFLSSLSLNSFLPSFIFIRHSLIFPSHTQLSTAWRCFGLWPTSWCRLPTPGKKSWRSRRIGPSPHEHSNLSSRSS